MNSEFHHYSAPPGNENVSRQERTVTQKKIVRYEDENAPCYGVNQPCQQEFAFPPPCLTQNKIGYD
jgi:hypothetical protein